MDISGSNNNIEKNYLLSSSEFSLTGGDMDCLGVKFTASPEKLHFLIV